MPYKDPEKARVNQKAYRESHKEKLKAYWQTNKVHLQAQHHANYLAHRSTRIEQAKANRQRLKLEVLRGYGNPLCACCGEAHVEFLSIDHINGGGNTHRRALGTVGHGFYLWLKRQGYPPGFRVLCMNCNFAMRHGGHCPHSTLQRIPEGIQQQPRAQLLLFLDGNL